MQDARLDDLCRTERFFTATLLPALLLRDPQKDAVAFVTWMADVCGIQARKPGGELDPLLPLSMPIDLEIVTELNVKRDLAFYQPERLAELIDTPPVEAVRVKNAGQQSVPDVVLLLGDLLVVIEGKFFGDRVTQEKLNRQLQEQQEEIEIMRAYLGNRVTRVAHVYLGPTKVEDLKCDGMMTWTQVRDYAAGFLGKDHYVVNRLAKAVKRYSENEGSPNSNGANYDQKLGIDDMKEHCLKHRANVLVGFAGGEKVISEISADDLARRLYKVDFVVDQVGKKDRRNWIPGDRMLELLSDKINS
jgi:hypothetical protein